MSWTVYVQDKMQGPWVKSGMFDRLRDAQDERDYLHAVASPVSVATRIVVTGGERERLLLSGQPDDMYVGPVESFVPGEVQS